jgi:hypothetical protein
VDFRDSINAIGKIRCIMITPLFLCLKYYRVNLFIICVGDFPAIRIMPGHILNKKASCTIFQGIIFVIPVLIHGGFRLLFQERMRVVCLL